MNSSRVKTSTPSAASRAANSLLDGGAVGVRREADQAHVDHVHAGGVERVAEGAAEGLLADDERPVGAEVGAEFDEAREVDLPAREVGVSRRRGRGRSATRRRGRACPWRRTAPGPEGEAPRRATRGRAGRVAAGRSGRRRGRRRGRGWPATCRAGPPRGSGRAGRSASIRCTAGRSFATPATARARSSTWRGNRQRMTTVVCCRGTTKRSAFSFSSSSELLSSRANRQPSWTNIEHDGEADAGGEQRHPDAVVRQVLPGQRDAGSGHVGCDLASWS